MKPTLNTNNNIFTYTIIGVVLFIAALGFTFTNFTRIATMEMSAMSIVGALGFSSVSLLAKAIKADKHRLKEPATA